MKLQLLPLGSVAALSLSVSLAAADSKPNVLFLAVDDMNDWIGCLAGTSPDNGPRALTPNLDKLAARGSSPDSSPGQRAATGRRITS